MSGNSKVSERDSDDDGTLPAYAYIRDALYLAVSTMLDEDYLLVALGCHEQAIAHRIALYLEPHFHNSEHGYVTDCEYNRDKIGTKVINYERPGEEDLMRPDIIVHKRNDAYNNVLAIEMKVGSKEATSDDLVKLKSLRGQIPYLYKGAAFVCVNNSFDDISDGVLRASISWYDVKEEDINEEEGIRMLIENREHVSMVTPIATQRRELESARKMSAKVRIKCKNL